MTDPRRNTVFWWIYVVVLVGAALFIAYSFAGILVLGLFGYYATRPIRARFGTVIESKSLAAGLTALTVLVPLLVLGLYVGLRTFQQIHQQFANGVIPAFLSRIVGLDLSDEGVASLLTDPPSLDRVTEVLSGAAIQQGLQFLDMFLGTLLVLSLGITLSYSLLVHDEALSSAVEELVGGRDTTVYSYALAVDSDLESIFFGNLLFVLAMSLVGTVTYALTNLVAPPDMQVPMIFALGVLTGITSLIPIIVSKIVYLPVVGYLVLTTIRSGGDRFAFVGVVLISYFLVLDILPQSVIQPYISGRQMNTIVLLFAYILGPILFGWYGFFLLPIIFVLMIEAVRIVLPELIRGETLVGEPGLAEETGARTEEMQDDGSDDPSSADPNA